MLVMCIPHSMKCLVFVCKCVHVCMHVRALMCVCVCVRACTHSVCMCTCVCTHMCTRTHTYIHTHWDESNLNQLAQDYLVWLVHSLAKAVFLPGNCFHTGYKNCSLQYCTNRAHMISVTLTLLCHVMIKLVIASGRIFDFTHLSHHYIAIPYSGKVWQGESLANLANCP